jgi:hypothetical protein
MEIRLQRDLPDLRSQPANQQLALVNHFGRQVRVQFNKELFVIDHFMFPGFAIHLL